MVGLTCRKNGSGPKNLSKPSSSFPRSGTGTFQQDGIPRRGVRGPSAKPPCCRQSPAEILVLLDVRGDGTVLNLVFTYLPRERAPDEHEGRRSDRSKSGRTMKRRGSSPTSRKLTSKRVSKDGRRRGLSRGRSEGLALAGTSRASVSPSPSPGGSSGATAAGCGRASSRWDHRLLFIASPSLETIRRGIHYGSTADAKKILLIDDEQDILAVTKTALEILGDFVTLNVTSSATEALEYLETLRAGSDPGRRGNRQPRRDRWSAARSSCRNAVPVVSPRTARTLGTAEAGAIDVVSKPFDPEGARRKLSIWHSQAGMLSSRELSLTSAPPCVCSPTSPKSSRSRRCGAMKPRDGQAFKVLPSHPQHGGSRPPWLQRDISEGSREASCRSSTPSTSLEPVRSTRSREIGLLKKPSPMPKETGIPVLEEPVVPAGRARKAHLPVRGRRDASIWSASWSSSDTSRTRSRRSIDIAERTPTAQC